MKVNRQNLTEEYSTTAGWVRDFSNGLSKNADYLDNLRSIMKKRKDFNTIDEKMADLRSRAGFDLVKNIDTSDKREIKEAGCGCGTCDGSILGNVIECECSEGEEIDCAGVCGGSAVEDECQICGGDDSTCKDCNGVINGTAYYDPHCGDGALCVGGNTGLAECTQDCGGIWGGTAFYDECEFCTAYYFGGVLIYNWVR